MSLVETRAARFEPSEEVLRRGLRVPNPWLVLGAVTTLVLWLASQRDFGPDGYFVPIKGVAVVLLALLPGILYLARVRRSPLRAEPMPFFPMIGVVYAIYYGLPVLVRDRVTFMRLEPTAAQVDVALDVAIAGWLAAWFGLSFVAPRLFGGQRPVVLDWDSKRSRVVAVLLLGIGMVAELAPDLVELPGTVLQIFRVFALLGRVGLGMIVIADLERGGWSARRLLVWGGLVPLYFLLMVRGGFVGAAIRPAAFLALLVWATRLRLPWLALFALAFFAILLRGAAVEFRGMLWRSASVAEMPPLERASTYVGIMVSDLTTRPAETIDFALEGITGRTAQLGLLAHAVHQTPEAIPYWRGDTYKTLPSSFIPRFIWRDKPTKRLGQRFGHRYAVLRPDDDRTSVNLPQLVECWINFGWLGAISIMGGIGVFYGFVYQKFNTRVAGRGGVLIGAIVFSELANIESDLSIVVGGLVHVVVALYIVMRICFATPRFARPAPALRAGGPA